MSLSASSLANYEVLCPLYPLFPRGQGYPEGYKLPPRMRPNDCLDLKKLTDILKESFLYREKNENEDDKEEVSVISVLSPYSSDIHVMIMDTSPNLLLPSPELINSKIFAKMCRLANKCVNYMRIKKSRCICTGYNWSPYSYGKYEEITGGQSITTKFHFAVWEWNELSKRDKNKEIKPEYKRALGGNVYGIHFSTFLYEIVKSIIDKADIFDEPEITSNCAFFPFKEGVCIDDVLKDEKLIKEMAEVIATNLSRLSSVLSDSDTEEMLNILKNIEHRLLTDDEKARLRRVPKIRPLEECLKKCERKCEENIILGIYQAALNREKGECESGEYWKKNFSYSLSVCESNIEGIKSGLRLYNLPLCGPGGVIESYKCLLTRPVSCLAPNESVIHHNELIWDLVDYLNSLE